MNTRHRVEFEVYVLYLNNMQAPNVERVQPVAMADTPELLEDLLAKDVEPWVDGQWHKYWKKGTALEWFNDFGLFGLIQTEWVEAERFEQLKKQFPWYSTPTNGGDPKERL